MPTLHQKKALKEGKISKKQYDKLPSHMLDAIIKKAHGKKKKKKYGRK